MASEETSCREHAAQQRQASMDADAIEAADEEEGCRVSSGNIQNVKLLHAVSLECLLMLALCSLLTRLEAAGTS